MRRSIDLRKNVALRGLAILLAVLTWWYVQSGEVHEVRVRVALEWVLPPERASLHALPSSATFSLRGTRAAVRHATQQRLALPVDATELSSGSHLVDLSVLRPDTLPAGISVDGVAPATVALSLDEVVQRKVALRVVAVGEPADGTLVDAWTVDPSVVEVRGPRATLANLHEVATHPVDISGLDRSETWPVEVDLPAGVRPAGMTLPMATVSLRSVNERRSFDAVPVFVWEHPGWQASPSEVQVTLEGKPSVLDQLSTEALVVFAHLDVEGPTSAVVGFPGEAGGRLRVLHPPGVQTLTIAPSTVRVEAP